MFCRGPPGPLAAPLPEISLSLERLVPGAGGATAVARLPFRHSERVEKLRLRLAALKSAVTVNNALVCPHTSAACLVLLATHIFCLRNLRPLKAVGDVCQVLGEPVLRSNEALAQLVQLNAADSSSEDAAAKHVFIRSACSRCAWLLHYCTAQRWVLTLACLCAQAGGCGGCCSGLPLEQRRACNAVLLHRRVRLWLRAGVGSVAAQRADGSAVAQQQRQRLQRAGA